MAALQTTSVLPSGALAGLEGIQSMPIRLITGQTFLTMLVASLRKVRQRLSRP